MKYNYNDTKFLTSVTSSICYGIQKNGIEIAFIGYSNVGKSTAINSLTNNKKLSRFSKVPGRTNMINFFKINNNVRFVDLPGYGYSIYKKNNKKKIYDTLLQYLKYRKCLTGIVLLIDIRRLLRCLDEKILKLVNIKEIKIIILLTKCDKLNKCNRNKQYNVLKQKLMFSWGKIPIILFSSLSKIGVCSVLEVIESWL